MRICRGVPSSRFPLKSGPQTLPNPTICVQDPKISRIRPPIHPDQVNRASHPKKAPKSPNQVLRHIQTPKFASNTPKSGRNRAPRPSQTPKSACKTPKIRPKMAPKTPKSGHKTLPYPKICLQDPKIRPKSAPKTPKSGPQTLPDPKICLQV